MVCITTSNFTFSDKPGATRRTVRTPGGLFNRAKNIHSVILCFSPVKEPGNKDVFGLLSVPLRFPQGATAGNTKVAFQAAAYAVKSKRETTGSEQARASRFTVLDEKLVSPGAGWSGWPWARRSGWPGGRSRWARRAAGGSPGAPRRPR